MSAREIIANARHSHACDGGYSVAGGAAADAALAALTSAGYRILGPDEVDAVTVEKCTEVAEERAEWVPLKPGEMRAAIRALSRASSQEVQE